MTRILLFLMAFFSAVACYSQEPEPEAQTEPQPIRPLDVSVEQEPDIDLLLNIHHKVLGQEKGFPGYRIQIAMESGNQSRVRIQKSQFEFEEKFPEVKSYINYDAPYYKLRIGDFRARLDARRFLEQIRKEYRNAFIVVDRINFPDLD